MQANRTEINFAETNKILFLNFRISYDSLNSVTNLEIINQIVRDGKLKRDQISKKIAHNDDLIIKFLNAEERTIKKIIIDNPLFQDVEYVDENYKLARRILKLNEAEFFIRTILNPEAKYILIEQFIENDEHIISDNKNIEKNNTILLKTKIIEYENSN